MSKSSRDAFEFRLTEFEIIIKFNDSYSTTYTVTKYDKLIGLFPIVFTFSFI